MTQQFTVRYPMQTRMGQKDLEHPSFKQGIHEKSVDDDDSHMAQSHVMFCISLLPKQFKSKCG
uniref:Uncharacterized protein n=1 Tax=Rhizophora mucronata TaxID=61149 RepID=A0A2P2N429_RHIMU